MSADASTVDEAVRSATLAADWTAEQPAAHRAAWLRALAAALDDAGTELVPLAMQESGLPEPRLRGELARTTAQLRLFAAAVEEGSWLEATVDHPDPSATPPIPDLRRMLVPLGPVAVYAASNFPFAFSVAGGDTASALAAGCSVIVKAHPGHPETSRRTVGIARSALLAAGAPDGLITLVEGFEAGVELIDHPALRAAAFTGSLRGGRALSDRAAARRAPIPFFGEYGSVNPVIVTPGADADRGEELAEGLAGSFTLGAGQFCTKPGIVLVPEGSRLQDALLDAVPDARQAMLTEGIGDAYVSGVAVLSAVPGVTALRLPEAPGDPAVLTVPATGFLAHAEQLTEEVFGPVTLMVRYRDESELLAAAARIDGSLTGTLHHDPAEDVRGILRVLAQRCGRVLFSGWPTGVAVSWAQHHGGPWPATNSQHTSVGVSAIRRFLRPLAFQDAPAELLPPELRDENPLRIPRRVDGVLER